MKVLVVEDDLNQAREIVEVILRVFGDPIEILGPFKNYKKAIQCIQENEIDIAVLDIQLQEDRYAGIHLGENIEMNSDTPILYVTGVSDHKIIEQTKSINNCNYIAKPFDDSTLERALKRAIKDVGEKPKNEPDKVSYKIGNRDKYWIKQGKSDYIGIEINDILFVEAKNHICEFNMIDGRIIEKRTTLTKGVFERTLAYYPNFYKMTRSFVINLDHVKNINGKRIMYSDLDKNKWIRIPDEQVKRLFSLIGLDE